MTTNTVGDSTVTRVSYHSKGKEALVPWKRAFVFAFALLLAVIQGTDTAQAYDRKTVTVSGRTCSVESHNPHATWSQSGERIVNSKTEFGYCTSAVSSITYRGELQKCSHQSWGCLWSTVASREGNITGSHTGRTIRYISKSCVNGHYRLRSRITVYVSGQSGTSAWSYSQNASVAC
jgi:hypothetical protein